MKQSDFNAEVEEDFGIGFECEDCVICKTAFDM